MGKRSDLHRRRDLIVLTVHQESVLLSQEGRFTSKEMHCDYMIPSTAFMTLDGEWPGLVLYGKIIPNGPRTVANEVVSGGKPFLLEQGTKEVVESFLMTRR